MLNFYSIFKELSREKGVIILMIFALAWGTFAIASMLSIGQGLRHTFAEQVVSTDTNLLTVTSSRTSQSFAGFRANLPVYLTKQDMNSITKLPNVTAVSPQYSLNANLRHLAKVVSEQVLAVNESYANIHSSEITFPGRFISSRDILNKSNVIVLGNKTAKDLFPQFANPTGNYIELGNKPFLVVGVMAAKPRIIAHESPEEFANWIPITTYELMYNPQFITAMDISYKNIDLLPQLKKHIQQTIAINRGYSPNDQDIVDFADYASQQQKLLEFFFGMQIFLGIIGGITLVIAGVGIANVMYATINSATREIGIRMAIGAKTFHIVLHYLKVSLITTFFGGLLGLFLTSLLVYGLKNIPMRGQFVIALGRPQPVFSLSIITMVMLVLGTVGFLAGLFPALKAANIDPAKALTYE